MIFETARLYLREMNEHDYASLCKMLQNENVMYAYAHAFDDAEAHAWLNNQINQYKNDGFGLWAVILKKTGEMIGQCGITKQDYNNMQVLEIGYLFQQEFWHKGFATEAAAGCKEYAFKKLHAPEVFSIIRDNNIASQNVALRNGMIAIDSFVKHYYGIDMPHIVFRAQSNIEK